MHVDDLLQEMTPAEFDERFAEYLLSGDGESRYESAAIRAELHNAATRQIEVKAGKKLNNLWIESSDLVPDLYLRKSAQKQKPKLDASDPEAPEQMARSLGCID